MTDQLKPLAAVVTGARQVGAVLTAKLPDGVVGTLQFTTTSSAGVKTNIANAAADSVNSLTYTVQPSDNAHWIGCDTSNHIVTDQKSRLATTWPKKSSASVVATITGTPTVGQQLTATLPAGVTGTLQFTRTLLAAPFTKSNIAGAVANAVNSLNYTLQQLDIGYSVGCDASNTVSASAPAVVAGAPGAALRNIATGMFYPDTILANLTWAGSRTPFYNRSGQPLLQAAVAMGNKYSTFGNVETSGPAGNTSFEFAIEYPAGTFTRLTTAGINAMSMPQGTAFMQTDLCPLATPIPPDAKAWVRIFSNGPAGNIVAFSKYNSDGTAEGQAGTSGALNYVMGGGEWTTQAAGVANQTHVCPLAVIGYTDRLSYCAYGDSESIGTNDINSAGVPLQSHFDRSIGLTNPVIHIGVFGSQANTWLTNHTDKLAIAAAFTNAAVGQFGINDVTQTARTAAQITTDLGAVAGFFKALGMRVGCCTLNPVTSGSWGSSGSQTVAPTNQKRIDINTAMLAGNLPNADVVWDLTQALETVGAPSESGIWKSPGYTSDGTHLDPTAQAAAASVIAAKPLGAQQPVIALPVVIGTAATYTTTDSNVIAQQWSLDGVDVAGNSTYVPAIADSAKALRVRDVVSGLGSATSQPVLPGVQNLKLSNTASLRAILAAGDGYIAGLGDSAMSGYTSGGTGTNSVNARANSYMAKLVAGLVAAGYPATADAAFGTDQTTVVADAVAFDPRFAVTGATGVLKGVAGSGSMPVLGGGSFFMAVSGAGLTYTPGTPFDTVDFSYLQDSTAGTIQVSGDNFATFTTLQRNAGANQIVLTTITVPSGSTTLSVRWASGAGGFCSGVLTRVAAVNKIKVIDGAMTGAQLILFGAPVNAAASGTAYLPRATLAQFAATGKRGVLLLNGWYNDRSQGATVQNMLDAYKSICDQAVSMGWDIMYVGYPSLDGSGLSQANFDAYEQAIVSYLISTYNAVILQESKIITNYATYNALGYYGDTLHIKGPGQQKIADTLTAICKLVAAGTLPA